MKYFDDCMSIESLRAEYRKNCLKLHPDKGGTAEIFADMQNEYERLIKLAAATEAGTACKENRKARYTYETEKELMSAMEYFLNIYGITVELCGCWLWITGDTFPVHEKIKEYGAKYSKNKGAWYWSADMGTGKHRGRYSWNKIRAKYGSVILESDARPIQSIAA
jgi:hypothetical protein